MNLYEIATEYRHALEEGNELIIDEMKGSLQEKASNVVKWCLERDAQVAAIQCERDRLDSLLKAEKSHAEWARDWLKKGMIAAQLTEINLGTMIVKVKNNLPSVDVQIGALENGLIEDRFVRTKVIREVDKVAVKKAMLEDGEIVAGCSITRGTSISIK